MLAGLVWTDGSRLAASKQTSVPHADPPQTLYRRDVASAAGPAAPPLRHAWPCILAAMRRGVLVLLAGGLVLAGCTRSVAPDFWATIEPSRAHVPFDAVITAADHGDSYTFYLPDETITQGSCTLEVTVDSLDWTATVETSYAGELHTEVVHASGSNAPPEIHSLTINGLRDRWSLKPLERTLLEFVVSAGGAIVDVEVWGSAYSNHYSIFIAPYDGSYHAVYQGQYREDACIVYPLYRSIPGEALPYAPTGLETGYPQLIGHSTNEWNFGGPDDEGQEIPAQQGYVKATAEDGWGQRTSRTFEVPILARDYEDTN
jgi:hypothetical protein